MTGSTVIRHGYTIADIDDMVRLACRPPMCATVADMTKERPKSGNLSPDAWQAIRRLKYNTTSADIQPTLSDVVVALAKVAARHPNEFIDAITEQNQ